MKAIATGDSGVELVDLAEPEAGPGELVLEMELCGLCGTDLYKLEHRTVDVGTVLGHELVGTVVGAGSGAEAWLDQRVVVPHHVACGDCSYCSAGSETQCAGFRQNQLVPGGFAERVRVRRGAVDRCVFAVPPELEPGAATFLEPTACVLRSIDRAQLTERSATVVILGAGSMGLLHLLALKAIRPGDRALIVEPLAERRRLALELGAAATAAPAPVDGTRADGTSAGIGPWAPDPAFDPDAPVRADAVFDTVGGARPLEDGLGMLRDGGTFVLFAHSARRERATLDLNRLFATERRIVGSYSGSRREQVRAFGLLADGVIDPSPLITDRLPLSRFSEAVERTRSRSALKILIEPDR